MIDPTLRSFGSHRNLALSAPYVTLLESLAS